MSHFCDAEYLSAKCRENLSCMYISRNHNKNRQIRVQATTHNTSRLITEVVEYLA